jgi:CRISPR-associated protein Cas1
VLEGEVRRAINTVGLEPSIGWLHEFTGAQTRESCVYDLMEPFRWIGDLTTIEAFESRIVDLKDFYFTGDDYRYHIEIEAKRRFLELLKARFNSGVKYKGKTWNWDTVIQVKTQELARFLLGGSECINFNEPMAALARPDTLNVRKIVLRLSTTEAKRLGIGRSTLHYLRTRSNEGQLLRVSQKVKSRLSRSYPSARGTS